MNTAVSI